VTLQIGTCSSPPEADLAKVGDPVENQYETVRGQIRDVDRRERPRLEQEPLMNRLAGGAGGNLLRAHDPGLEPAGGDLAAQPLGRRGRGVKADKLAPRGFERRPDAVKSVDQRNLGLPPRARPIAGV
jgi:hypothetical protein